MTRDELKRAVIDYQIARLKRDYTDFTDDPRWKVCGDFFFDRVYGCPDKGARDEAGRRLFAPARKILGEEIGGNLAKVMRLNELTDILDRRLVDELLGMDVPTFTEADYERAYALCQNYAERKEQIDLSVGGLRYFHRLALVPGLGVALALLKPYAAIKRATVVYEFLRDGYRGFRTIQDIEPFVKAVEERELARLDRIYSRKPSAALIKSGLPSEARKGSGGSLPATEGRTTRRTTRRNTS